MQIHPLTPDALYRCAGLTNLASGASLDEIESCVLRLVGLLAASRADELTSALLRAAAQQRLRGLGFTENEAERVLTAAFEDLGGIAFPTFTRALAWAESELAASAEVGSDG